MLECILSKYEKSKVDSCCDHGCSLPIDDKLERLILKGDMLEKNMGKKMCDCVIFRENRTIILVELKTKIRRYRDFKEKFANAAEKSLKISKECGEECSIAGIVIMKKKGVKKNIFSIIEHEARPVIHGKKPKIFFGTCGCTLSMVFRKRLRDRA